MNNNINNSIRILQLFSWYLNTDSRMINQKMIEDLASTCDIDSKYAYYFLLASIFELDVEDNASDRLFSEKYLLPSINELNCEKYLNNLYYKNIHPKPRKYGNWELTYKKYFPYELFVYNEGKTLDNDIFIPSIGYFKEPFEYLTVLQNNHEWMMITPNEIETMNKSINDAFGSVVTFGLGLGYFAYMTSQKTSVKKITIVEKDLEVIKLFSNTILPLFNHRDKINIINVDAFEYIKSSEMQNYDFCFIDLWHDASDGIEMYLQFKEYESLYPKVSFKYWIEDTIIQTIKIIVYQNINTLIDKKIIKNDANFIANISNDNILEIIKMISKK